MLQLSDEDKLPRSWRSAEPADILAEAAQRLSLPYSRRYVRALFGATRNKGSAQGLVEAAKSLGLEVTAGRAQAGALETPDPGVALVSLSRRRGFLLIEAVSPKELRVWDPVYGSRAMARAEFERGFDGLVLLLERPAAYRPPSAERGRLASRLVEALFEELRPRTELAGPRGTPLAALAVLIALIGLVTVASLRAGGFVVPALAALSGVGLLLCFAMLRSVYGGSESVNILCGGDHSGCNDLLRSRYAKVLGVPASGLGLAFFAAQLLVLGTCAAGPTVAGALALASVPEALVFFWIMVRARQFCRLCAFVHGANFGAAALFVGAVWPPSTGALELASAAAAWAVLFLVVLTGVVPHLVRADRSGILEEELETLRESPWWLGHELEQAQAIPDDPAPVTVLVSPGPAEGGFQLWGLASVDCPSCAAWMKSLEAWVVRDQNQSLRVRVGFTGGGSERWEAAVLAAGLASGGARFFDAYRWVRAFPDRNRPDVDPFAELSRALDLPREALEAHRAEALAMPSTGHLVCKHHTKQGDFCALPLVVFEGRQVKGSLSVIENLITDRPDLFRAATAPGASTP